MAKGRRAEFVARVYLGSDTEQRRECVGQALPSRAVFGGDKAGARAVIGHLKAVVGMRGQGGEVPLSMQTSVPDCADQHLEDLLPAMTKSWDPGAGGRAQQIETPVVAPAALHRRNPELRTYEASRSQA